MSPNYPAANWSEKWEIHANASNSKFQRFFIIVSIQWTILFRNFRIQAKFD